MFIEKPHLVSYQNEEHFGLHTFVQEVVEEADPVLLKIKVQADAYKLKLLNERIALDQVQKSSYTRLMDLAEGARDQPIRSFFKVVDGMLDHFDPVVSASAYRIKVINDSFRDITRLSDSKQSSAEVSYVDALKANMADITILLLTAWVVEIESKENAFLDLKKSRFEEKDEKTTLNMKDVRVDVDKSFNALRDRINAFITIDGDVQYATLVTKINNRIHSFNTGIAQRKGQQNGNDTPETPAV